MDRGHERNKDKIKTLLTQADLVRDLSEARFGEKVQVGRAFRRAFDKAVRTKPPVVAADAGLMQIQ